jgi:hypothetical protein
LNTVVLQIEDCFDCFKKLRPEFVHGLGAGPLLIRSQPRIACWNNHKTNTEERKGT